MSVAAVQPRREDFWSSAAVVAGGLGASTAGGAVAGFGLEARHHRIESKLASLMPAGGVATADTKKMWIQASTGLRSQSYVHRVLDQAGQRNAVQGAEFISGIIDDHADAARSIGRTGRLYTYLTAGALVTQLAFTGIGNIVRGGADS